MPFTLYADFNSTLLWPASLSGSELKKLDKKEQLTDLINTLNDAKIVCEVQVGTKVPYPPRRADDEDANAWVQRATAFVRSTDLKKLVGTLQIVKKRVENRLEAAERKKSPEPLDKKLVPVLKQIAAEAEAYANSLDSKDLIPRIGTLAQKMMEAEHVTVLERIGPVIKASRQVRAKGHPEIRLAVNALNAWDDNADEEAKNAVRFEVGTNLRACCRNMGQNVGNLLKAIKHGGDIPGIEPRDLDTLPKLHKTLSECGNTEREMELTGGMDKAAMVKLIRTIKANADLYDQIVDRFVEV